jgi:hypothetical protein
VTIQSAQTTLVVVYTIRCPDPRVRSAQTTLLVACEIPWSAREVRIAQVTMVIVHDLTPLPPGEGSGTITILCQIIG